MIRASFKKTGEVGLSFTGFFILLILLPRKNVS